MAKEKQLQINRKELIGLISSASGYHKYEIEDIMKSFVKIMQQCILDGAKVKIDGLGSFSLKHYKPRTFFSKLTGNEYSVNTAPKFNITPDSTIKNLIRERYEASSEMINKEEN